ncbi:spermidine synthase [bacterium]|nr:spermidine synthase [bacterium]
MKRTSLSDLEVLAYESTCLGMICLRRRKLLFEPGTVVTEITLDHELLMSSCNTDSERALASCALDMHEGSDLRVLVGGLGLGYTARELLRSDRVADVEVVEFLPQVIDWLDRGLVPLAGELRADSRFSVSSGDVYVALSNPPERERDLILVDVDHSPDERLGTASGSFYTEEGLESAKKHLAPDGVLGVWSYVESPPFADALREVFDEIRIEQRTFENRLIGEEETNWLFFARG